MSLSSIDPNIFTASAQSEQDKMLAVRFYVKPKEDKKSSKEQGRPIFKDTEYIEIRTPGKRDYVSRPVSDLDRNRFQEAYRNFKNRTSVEEGLGTPLTEWNAISRSMAEELAFFNVKTVEQLATMADTQAGQFRQGLEFKANAKKWLDKANQEKPFLEMEQRNEELKAELDETKDVLKMLKDQLEEMKSSGSKKAERSVSRTKKVASKLIDD